MNEETKVEESQDEQTPLHRIVHTPGPWEFDESNFGVCNRHGYGLLDSLGETLGVTVHTTDVFGLPVREAEANARLIAAAPDLLEALELLWLEVAESGNGTANDFGWKKAREKTLAALDKANG